MVAFIVIIGIILDQVSKYVIAGQMSIGQSYTVIQNFFAITYAENTGMAWSLLSGQQAFFCLAAAAAIGAMLWYIIFKQPDRLTKISLSLMISGAAGNLIDRLFLGHVRDFLDFYIFGYDFPIFNVADSLLTIGVVLLVIASLLEEKKNGKTGMED